MDGLAVDVKIKLQGDADLIAALQSIEESVAKKIVIAAVKSAMKPIEIAAKRMCPVGLTERLMESIGTVAKQYPSGVAYAVVGPRHGFDIEVSGMGRDGKIHTWMHRPTKIAHLVEFGHRLGRGKLELSKTDKSKGRKQGRQIGYVDKKPFLRPAFDTYSEGTVRNTEILMWRGIEQECARLQKKAASLNG